MTPPNHPRPRIVTDLLSVAVSLLPFVLCLLVVRPVAHHVAVSGYLSRYVTFLVFFGGWHLSESITLVVARGRIGERVLKEWQKILLVSLVAVVALSLFQIAQAEFRFLSNSFGVLVALISTSSLRAFVRQRAHHRRYLITSFLFHTGVTYFGICILFGSWAGPPLLFAISLGLLMTACEVAVIIDRATVLAEERKSFVSLYSIMVMSAPLLLGLMSLAHILPPLFTAMYVVLPLVAHQIRRLSNNPPPSLAREAASLTLLVVALAVIIGLVYTV